MIEIQPLDGPALLGTGAWRISEESYHADPCPAPSLSSSVAKVLIAETPGHARLEHPRLNPEHEPRVATAGMDFGTACHRLLFEGGDRVTQIEEYNDWRTKAAKEAKAAAVQAGEVALLSEDFLEAQKLAGLAGMYAHDAGHDIASAEPEVTVLTEIGGAWCRIRVDAMTEANGKLTVYDYKVGQVSPNPATWGKHAASMGYDVQEAFYRRVLENEYPEYAGRIEFIFLAQQRSTGFLSLNSLSHYDTAIAARQVDYAIETWEACMKSGKWPAYPQAVNRVTLPAWHHAAWIEREESEEV